MMNLFVLRHATSEARSRDGTDAARRLTVDGQREISRVGRCFGSSFRMLDAICHSPRTRARETAQGLAALLGLESRLRSEPVLDCGGTLEAQVALVERLAADGLGNVAWVAHEPEVSGLVCWFLGLDAVRVSFEPASVAHVEFFARPRRGGGVLRAFVPPSFADEVLGST